MRFFNEMRRAFETEQDNFKKQRHGEKASRCKTCIDYFRINNPHIALRIIDPTYPFYYLLLAHTDGTRSGLVFEEKEKGFAYLHAHAKGELSDFAYVSDVVQVDPYLAYPNIMAGLEEKIRMHGGVKIAVDTFNMTNAAAHSAKSLADKLKSGKVPSPFTVRDVQRKGWAALGTHDDVVAAVEWLVDADWIRPTQAMNAGRTRTTYTINPRITP